MAAKIKPRHKFAGAAMLTGAACVVASFAFISLELALLAAGFFTAAGFVMHDLRRRRFWENGLSFRVKKISDEQKDLNAKVTATRQDLFSLKQQIADISRRVDTQDDIIDALHPTVGALPKKPPLAGDIRPPQNKQNNRARAPAAPLAARPGQRLAPQAGPAAANDDSYDELSDMVVRELLTHAVQSKNIEIFVQPIVRLPQRRVRFYEIYARVRARPGMYLPARRYMNLARQAALANEIDNILLTECLKTVQASAHVERAAPLFVNISGATLKNTVFMKRLLTFLASHRHLAPRLIFEISHADYKKLEPAPREILRGLGRLGCSVSFDHVENIDLDLAELQRFHVRFIKMEVQKILPYTRSDRSRTDLQRQKRKWESNGVNLIVNKVETEADLLEILDFDISYGQGHLFGRPDFEAAYRRRKAA